MSGMRAASETSVAIVGFGRMGQRHFDAFSALGAGCAVRAAFDTDPRVVLPNGVRRASSLSEAIDAADLVVVATPASAHREVALFAIDRGKHVLIEKPLARTAGEAREVVQRAKARGIELFVGLTERFNPVVRFLRAHLGDDVQSLSIERVGPYPAVASNLDILSELAVHDVDLVSHLGRTEVRSLDAEIVRERGRDRTGSLEVTTTNGLRARLLVSWCAAERRRKLVAIEHDRQFVADLLTGEIVIELEGRKEAHLARGPSALISQANAVLSRIACGERTHDDFEPATGEDGVRVLEAIAKGTIAVRESRESRELPWRTDAGAA